MMGPEPTIKTDFIELSLGIILFLINCRISILLPLRRTLQLYLFIKQGSLNYTKLFEPFQLLAPLQLSKKTNCANVRSVHF